MPCRSWRIPGSCLSPQRTCGGHSRCLQQRTQTPPTAASSRAPWAQRWCVHCHSLVDDAICLFNCCKAHRGGERHMECSNLGACSVACFLEHMWRMLPLAQPCPGAYADMPNAKCLPRLAPATPSACHGCTALTLSLPYVLERRSNVRRLHCQLVLTLPAEPEPLLVDCRISTVATRPPPVLSTSCQSTSQP